MTDATGTAVQHEIERQNLEPLRNSIQENTLKATQARQDVVDADDEIAQLQSRIRGLERWRHWRFRVAEAIEARVKAERSIVRSTEDYEAGID